jgi:Raf kinase inhibitor-like YbhB/YbcL family protein
MEITSSAFQPGGAIPARYTCEGEDVSPEFSWTGIPAEAKSLVLIVHDPDAPKANGFTHWVLFNIPPNLTRIEENVSKHTAVTAIGTQGKNDAGRIGYMGPCPPSGTHRYFARLYALREKLNLEPGASYEDVKSAINQYLIEQTEVMGTYAKQKGRSVA